jgi:hypothetical protein
MAMAMASSAVTPIISASYLLSDESSASSFILNRVPTRKLSRRLRSNFSKATTTSSPGMTLQGRRRENEMNE